MPDPSTTHWLTDTEQAAWRSYVDASQRLAARLEQDLKAHGATHDDYRILVLLSEAPGERMRMSDLADVGVESRSRLSHHVGRLEARGLVARKECPFDGRGLFAELQPEGRRLIEELAPHHVDGVRAWFVDILSDEELSTVGSAFARISDALRSVEPPCPGGADQPIS